MGAISQAHRHSTSVRVTSWPGVVSPGPIFKFSLNPFQQVRGSAQERTANWCRPEARAVPRVWCGTCCRRRPPRAHGQIETPRRRPTQASASGRDVALVLLDEPQQRQHGCLGVFVAAHDLRGLGLRGPKVSPVEFPSDHVDRPEGGNHVGDHVAGENFGQGRHDRKAGRTDSHTVRAAASIAHHVEAELSIGALPPESTPLPWAAVLRGRT